MAKRTTLVELEARLDTASRCMAAQMARITELEAQQVSTRKQLWYLQKVAKGEFAIGTYTTAPTEDQVITAEDLVAAF